MNTQINVSGWQTIYSESWYTIKRNKYFCVLLFNGTVNNVTVNGRQIGSASVVPNNLKPSVPVSTVNTQNDVVLYVREDGYLFIRSHTGADIPSTPFYGQLIWEI